MNELINIKVIQKDFNGEKKRFVNARELHRWLGVGKFFANWIKDRIEKYGFVENLDYFITIANSGNGFNIQTTGKIVDAKTGKVVAKEYVLCVDMAKELAMVENSEIGKEVRKYFIRVEGDFKKVMRIATLDPKIINQLASQFSETREETKDYRKDFTRNYMYEEILLIIGAFEAGLSGEIEKEFKKLGRILAKDEFVKKFNEFASQKNWLVYQKRARNIMATYDEELRRIKHPKLIDYKKEFSQEDIQKLIG